ncbi:MAG: hypothetical protein K2L38_06240 [Dysosmobacter sp.]|nr:hypothetical protein [Dysosmobacter sp.]
MRIKKWLCLVFACIAILSNIIPSVGAVSAEPYDVESVERFTGRFSMNVSANKRSTADSSFFMDVEQSVTISASYTPRTASVDFGLIGPDERFYYQNTAKGLIEVTFDIIERGNYTLAIRNNSSYEINVSGHVYH